MDAGNNTTTPLCDGNLAQATSSIRCNAADAWLVYCTTLCSHCCQARSCNANGYAKCLEHDSDETGAYAWHVYRQALALSCNCSMQPYLYVSNCGLPLGPSKMPSSASKSQKATSPAGICSLLAVKSIRLIATPSVRTFTLLPLNLQNDKQVHSPLGAGTLHGNLLLAARPAFGNLLSTAGGHHLL